jgi:hypothetical protein
MCPLISLHKKWSLTPLSYLYLRYLLDRLPYAYASEEYKALMLQHIDQANLLVNF